MSSDTEDSRCFGHVCQIPRDNIVRQAYKQDFKGQWKRGRPLNRWTDKIRNDTGLPRLTAAWHATTKKRYGRRSAKDQNGLRIKVELSEDNWTQQPPTSCSADSLPSCLSRVVPTRQRDHGRYDSPRSLSVSCHLLVPTGTLLAQIYQNQPKQSIKFIPKLLMETAEQISKVLARVFICH